MSAARRLPRDWPLAVRAGLEAVAAGWAVAAVPTLAVYVATSSLDAAAALSAGGALRTATALWSLSLGGSYGTPDGPDGVLGLPLLGLSLVVLLLARSAVRRSRLLGLSSAACAVAASALATVVLLVLATPAGSRTWPTALVLPGLVALVALADLQRRGAGSPALSGWWSRRPAWVDPALHLARTTALAAATLSAVVLVAAAVDGAPRVSRLHDALSSSGPVAVLGLLAIQAAWLPDALVWALSWLVGPGFRVGQGSLFSPDAVIAGPVPTLPVLGLLPTGPLGGEGSGAGLYVPLVLTLASLAATWRSRRALAGLALGQSALAGAAGAVTVAAGAWLACLAARGPIGPGRLAEVGPVTGLTVLLVAMEVGVGLVAGSVIVHPRARVLTEHGVRSAALAARGAAGGARSRVGAGIAATRETARERSGRGGDAGATTDEDATGAATGGDGDTAGTQAG
ncbi:cell division protein PerM [Actinomyces sp. W5033]|uniref:cell division protein PerM n=1 Tax=Actinomyces sp. W5033 TaxID=3446479 RepID=UPI003EE1CA38